MRHNVVYPNQNNIFPNSNSSGQPSVNIFNSNNQPQQGSTSTSSMPSRNLWNQQQQGVPANSQAPSNIFTNNRSGSVPSQGSNQSISSGGQGNPGSSVQSQPGTNIFSTGQSGNVQVVSGPQTGGVNIFNSNIANQSPNIQQPRGPQDQNNQNPQNTVQQTEASLPQKPSQVLIKESLRQTFSFVEIKRKIERSMKLTAEEINFVRNGGGLHFKRDICKSDIFKSVTIKKHHLGLLQGETRAQYLKSTQIENLWIDLITNLAQICQTHQMNGYFLLKHIVRQNTIYQQLYKPKPGLENKVFEVNVEFLKTFYKLNFSNKEVPNKDSHQYQLILQKLILLYYEQWRAYLSIVQATIQGHFQTIEHTQNQQPKTNSVRSLDGDSVNQPSKVPSSKARYIKYDDLQKSNTLVQLWNSYKQLACSTNLQKMKKISQEEAIYRKGFEFRTAVSLITGRVIGKMLQSKYSQEKLMSDMPIRLHEVVRFIAEDVRTVQMHKILEPFDQKRFIQNSLSIMLGIIPFIVFVVPFEPILLAYFNHPNIKSRSIISAKQKTQLLEFLSNLQSHHFAPLKIWAQLELPYYKNFSDVSLKQVNVNFMRMREKHLKETVDVWEDYFQTHQHKIGVFNEEKWKNFVAMLIKSIKMENLMGSNVLRQILLRFSKKYLKFKAEQFFNFTDSICDFERSSEYRFAVPVDNFLVRSQQEKENDFKTIQFFAKTIINYLDLYSLSKFIGGLSKSEYIDDSYRVFSTLLKNSSTKICYIKAIIKLTNEVDKPPLYFFKMMTRNLYRKFDIAYNQMGPRVTFKNLGKNEREGQTGLMGDKDVEQAIKFILQLVKHSSSELNFLQSILFSDRPQQMAFEDEVPGIMLISFLCMVLKKIDFYTVDTIKTLRYTIHIIDFLFLQKNTRSILLFILSIFFPLNSQEQKPSFASDSYSRRVNIASSHSPIYSMMALIQQHEIYPEEEQKQILKLRRALSHHLNHCFRYIDNFDDYFTIKRQQNLNVYKEMFNDITKEWNFKSTLDFMKQSNAKIRSMDWFYTISGILATDQLLSIDIDTLILFIRKLKLTTTETPLAGCFNALISIINEGSVTQQLLKYLQPRVVCHKGVLEVHNLTLDNYMPNDIPIDNSPNSKYGNKVYLQSKTLFLQREEQYQIIRKIFQWLRLIEEILSLNLNEDSLKFIFLHEVIFYTEISHKLTAQGLHMFQTSYVSDLEQVKTTVNILAVLVATLELYKYKFKFSFPNPTYFGLVQLQMQTYSNISYHKLFEKEFSTQVPYEDFAQKVIKHHKSDLNFLSERFFDSAIFQSRDFGLENDETSLKNTVFAIVQILIHLGKTNLVSNCLKNFAYPMNPEDLMLEFLAEGPFQVSCNPRTLVPLLIRNLINSFPSDLAPEIKNISFLSRRLESLAIFATVECLYFEILFKHLGMVKRSLTLIIESDDLTKKGMYGKGSWISRVNLINKMTMLIYNFTKQSKETLSLNLFYSKVLNQLLIYPTNLFKTLLVLMQRLKSQHSKFQPFLVQTAQPLPNYIGQCVVTRNALYRATYDILFRTIIIIYQDVNIEALAELMELVFRVQDLIQEKLPQADEVKFISPAIQLAHNLRISPKTTISISRNQTKPGEKRISIPVEQSEFSLCLRHHPHKYGSNFLYPINQCFQAYLLSRPKSKSIFKSHLKQIQQFLYTIQIVNCLKSLSHAYLSMVNSYFQLLGLATTIGVKGRNISVDSIDKTIPQLYEKPLSINRYALRSKASFEEIFLRMRNLMPHETFVGKIISSAQNFVNWVAEKQYLVEGQLYFASNMENFNQNKELKCRPINLSFTGCPVADPVLFVVTNLLSKIPRHFIYSQHLQANREKIPDIGRTIDLFLNLLMQYKIECSLKTKLLFYECLLSVDRFLLDNFPTYFETYLNHQAKVLDSLREIVYITYEKQKPTLFLESSQQWVSQKKYSLAQVNDCIQLVCGISKFLLNEVQMKKQQILQIQIAEMRSVRQTQLIQLAKEHQNQMIKNINYILKLLIDNYKQIPHSLSKLTLMELCNWFYIVQKEDSAEIWPFYHPQLVICQDILNEAQRSKDEFAMLDFGLQVFCALDTFTNLAQLNPVTATSQLIDKISLLVFLKQPKQSKQPNKPKSPKQASKKLKQSSDQPINNLQYTLRTPFHSFSLQSLIFLKKIMVAILVCCPQQSYSNSPDSKKLNALFLQVSNFRKLNFSFLELDKIIIETNAQKRLQNIRIAENDQKIKQKRQKKPRGSSNETVPDQTTAVSASLEVASISSTHYYGQRMSLMTFICFINQLTILECYLLTVKSGLISSSYTRKHGSAPLPVDECHELWDSLLITFQNIEKYLGDCIQYFLQNDKMVKNLTLSYNYIAKEPAYTAEFSGLNLYLDHIEEDYIKNKIIETIANYTDILTLLTSKCRQLQWKASDTWEKERLALLNRAMQLLQKTKLQHTLKAQSQSMVSIFNQLRKSLNDQIKTQRQQSSTIARNY